MNQMLGIKYSGIQRNNRKWRSTLVVCDGEVLPSSCSSIRRRLFMRISTVLQRNRLRYKIKFFVDWILLQTVPVYFRAAYILIRPRYLCFDTLLIYIGIFLIYWCGKLFWVFRIYYSKDFWDFILCDTVVINLL